MKSKKPSENENCEDNETSSLNFSTKDESNAFTISLKKINKKSTVIDNNFDKKSHFSPQSSVRIKVIDETDTDNCDY